MTPRPLKKRVCLKVGDTPVVIVIYTLIHRFWKIWRFPIIFRQTLQQLFSPGSSSSLPGRFVPFRLLLKHSPNVKLCSCGHFTSSKDRSKSFPKVKLRRLLGNGTWPCYDPGYAMIASCHLWHRKVGGKNQGGPLPDDLGVAGYCSLFSDNPILTILDLLGQISWCSQFEDGGNRVIWSPATAWGSANLGSKSTKHHGRSTRLTSSSRSSLPTDSVTSKGLLNL